MLIFAGAEDRRRLARGDYRTMDLRAAYALTR
jgi:hypothetical protein